MQAIYDLKLTEKYLSSPAIYQGSLEAANIDYYEL